MAASSAIMGLEAYASDDQASALSVQGADVAAAVEADANELADSLDNVNIGDSGSTSSGGVHVSHSDSASRRSSSIDSAASNSTMSGGPISNVVDNAVRNAVTMAIAQFAPVIEQAIGDGMRMMGEEMVDSTYETNNKLEALDTKLDSINIETNDKVETLNTKLDNIITMEHAMGLHLDDLQQATSNAFVSVKTDIDALKHTTAESEAAIENTIKAHKSFNARLPTETKLDDLVDAINTNTHATEAKLDDLSLSMTKASGYVDTRMDTLKHAVDTGEHAVTKAIKLHESSTTSASDRSTTLILKKIEKGNRGLQKHNSRQAQTVQDETNEHVKKLCASIDKLGKDGIKLPEVLKELSQIGDQIGDQIKQQTAEAKAHAETITTIAQEDTSEKIKSFKSDVFWLKSDASDDRRYLREWELASQKQSQTVEQAGNFVFNKMVKMESLFAGIANSLQSAVAPVGGDLKRIADACEELDTRSKVLTDTIQTNLRTDLTAFSNDMKEVGDERSRKIMLQESKAYGLHAMYLRPQEKRNTLYVLFMIESRTFKQQLPFQTAIPAQRCTKVANILGEAWEKCYLEEVPKDLKKRCVKTEVFLEESVWDQMEEMPLVVGSEYEDTVYGEWYKRNMEFGIKNHFKIRVEMKRTI